MRSVQQRQNLAKVDRSGLRRGRPPGRGVSPGGLVMPQYAALAAFGRARGRSAPVGQATLCASSKPAKRGRAPGCYERAEQRGIQGPAAQPDRAAPGGQRRLCRLGVDHAPPAQAARPAGPSAIRTHSAKAQQAARVGGHQPRSGVLLGHHLSADAGAGPALLPLPVRGSVQPQDRWLAGV